MFGANTTNELRGDYSHAKPDFTIDQDMRLYSAADQAMDENTAKFTAQEAEVIEYFKKEGKKVYEPDQNAFRTYAQKKYLDQYGKDWPKDALERINAIK